MTESTKVTCSSCPCVIDASKAVEKDGKTYCCQACADGNCGCQDGVCTSSSCCG